VTLPSEILDKILEHIPTDERGRQTLIACALVAAWWTGPSQRRLFSSVSVDNNNYQRWVDGVALSGAKTHLLHYVRSFRHHRVPKRSLRYSVWDLPKEPGEYIFALRNIHSLQLVNIRIDPLSKELQTCLSAFRETLTSLTLLFFVASFSAFVSLIDYFPNITALQLGMFALNPDEGPLPSLSRPLQGKIHIRPPHPGCLGFIDRLAKLDQECEELVIGATNANLETEFFVRALQFSTAKYLRLLGSFEREYSLHTLSSLNVLTQPFNKSWTER